MKITAYIPARGGSKGIPGKNIKDIAGRPLICWVLSAAVEAECVDNVVLGTDSDEIAQTVKAHFGDAVGIFRRSAANCTDTAGTEAAMLEFAEKNDDFTHIMLIQATSPLITARHIDEAVKKYRDNAADSLIALVRQIKFVWKENADGMVTPVNYNPLQRPRRQDFDGILTEPGAFYLSSRDALLTTKCRISGKTVGYELPEECYTDLDTLHDWSVVESVLRERCGI